MTDRAKQQSPQATNAVASDRREFLIGSTALIGAAGALGASAVAKPVQASTPKRGGTFRIAVADGAVGDNYDTAHSDSSTTVMLNYITRGNLTEIDADNKLVPDVAESWESDTGAKRWVFKLRKGIEFHNGKSVDANDVIATMNHHIGEDSASGAKALFSAVESIKADGKDTVVFELSDGNADFPYFLADYHMGILPADSEGRADWSDGVGTGGYVFEKYEPGVRASLTRNPNYWRDDRAYFDQVEALVIKDIAARSSALVTGEVDLVDDVDPKTIDLLAKDPNVEIDEVASGSHTVMSMRMDMAPFDDNDVRLALKLALDRETLLSTVLKGHGTIGNDTPISPTMPFHADLPQRQYDPEKAKFHLKKAGHDSLKVTLSAAEVWVGAVDAAVLYKEHAAKAGIELEIDRVPKDGFWTDTWLKKPFVSSWWGPRPTPDVIFSIAYSRGAAWSETRFDHDRFNVLLTEARAEVDDNKRAEMYAEMQLIVRDEGGTIVPFFRNFLFGRRANVHHGPALGGNWQMDGYKAAERWWFA